MALVAAENLLLSGDEELKSRTQTQLKDLKTLWEETCTYIIHCHRYSLKRKDPPLTSSSDPLPEAWEDCVMHIFWAVLIALFWTKISNGILGIHWRNSHNLGVTAPSAPITSGSTVAFTSPTFSSFAFSLFYFSSFLCSFILMLLCPGIDHHCCLLLFVEHKNV